MIIKRILVVVAAILILIGASQLAYARWWTGASQNMVYSRAFHLWGLAGVLLGVILLLAVVERVIGLRLFATILGIYSLGWGVVLLANPQLVRDVFSCLVWERSRGFQTFVFWSGGVIRIALGIVILYALAKAPKSAASPESLRAAGPGSGTAEPPKS